jgi:soluble lytic murein transglycosylase-like protein
MTGVRGRTIDAMSPLGKFLMVVCLPLVPFGTAGAGAIFVGADAQESVVLSNVPSGEEFRVLVEAPPEPANPGRADGASTERGNTRVSSIVIGRAAAYAPLVEEVARETRLDPGLLHAVIATESAYNPVARSPKGAQGLMQLMPATARRYGVVNAYEPRHNILGGARYLADLLVLFDQDVQLALAAYNAGEQAVLRHGRRIPPYRETGAYVPRVLDYYRVFSKNSL